MPPPAPTYNWAGFYIGFNVGYGWAKIDRVATPSPVGVFNSPAFTVGSSPAGFVGGVQLGYNWQFDSFVFGAETDFQGTTLGGSVGVGPLRTLAGVPFPGSNSRLTTELDWFGTVRGRLGVTTFVPELLAYVTGGFAYGDVKISSRTTFLPGAPAGIFAGSRSTTETGWTVGGGLEYGFSNWSARVEYLHVSLDAPSYDAFPLAPNPPFRVRHNVSNFDLNLVRFGLNCRF
jgi:outer membrane immunogenic protein